MAGKRAAQGAGTIRQKTVTRKGKKYTYWEARITVGRDPGTGKQIQRSFSGKTQKEVREKMQAAAVEVNTGTYIPPSRMTVGQWLAIWQAEYLGSVKPGTARSYRQNIKNYIVPALGAVKLTELHPHIVQTFINGLQGYSTGTIRLAYRVLHVTLEKAVEFGYIPKNPTTRCVLPRMEKKDITPLDDAQLKALMQTAAGTRMENIILVAAFAGLRISEILGLTWDCVDFDNSTLNICKQLNTPDHIEKHGLFSSTKSGMSRTITAAQTVMLALKDQRIKQAEYKLKAGKGFSNPQQFVFTNDDGSYINQYSSRYEFNTILKAAGLEGFRFHDLRHTYAVNAIRAGDDIKSVQGNLGHATAAFTLDRYGHFTERMKTDSAARMEGFIKGILNL